MSTVAQILSWVRRKYPRSADTNVFTESNMIADLDDIHKEEFVKLRKMKSYYLTDTSLTTIADTIEYTLPTLCSMPNIIILQVENSNGDWEEFEFADGEKDTSDGDYYTYGSAENKFILTRDDEALDAGLTIRIKYWPNPTTLTATTQTPGLDELYHPLLKYRLAQMCAVEGESPDSAIANGWQQEYNEFFKWVKDDLNEKKGKTTTTVQTVQDVYGM